MLRMKPTRSPPPPVTRTTHATNRPRLQNHTHHQPPLHPAQPARADAFGGVGCFERLPCRRDRAAGSRKSSSCNPHRPLNAHSRPRRLYISPLYMTQPQPAPLRPPLPPTPPPPPPRFLPPLSIRKPIHQLLSRRAARHKTTTEIAARSDSQAGRGGGGGGGGAGPNPT
jgi:hypothetical protein